MKNILETQRLWLRELRLEDFDDACLLLQDPDVMYAYEGPFSREEVQDWLDRQLRRYREDGFGLWGVIEKKSGTLIGQCGITRQQCGDSPVPEVGYLLRRAYWHQGYATEAARACKEYAFQILGFQEVYSIIRDTNLPSQRVALRNGMHQVGQIVKHYKGVDMPHRVFKVERDARLLRHLPHRPEVCAFSTTRHGGVSTGTYASLNCTSYTGDDPACVQRNREILLNALPQRPSELIIPWQTHGTRVLPIDDAFLSADAGQRHALLQGIDALTTDRPGICLCISTADCIPILLYDKKHQAIAAIHAGWRGTVNFIIGHTLERMRILYGTDGADTFAVIGPGISLDAFEVGDEVYEAFRLAGFPMERIARKQEKWHLDLWEANRLQLLDFGVPSVAIETAGICTYTQCEDFFSARRLGIKSGRMLTGIIMNANQELKIASDSCFKSL